MFKTTAVAAMFAIALGGTAFAQGNSTNAGNNKVDVGGGKGLVVVDVSQVDVTALNNLIDDTNIAIPATVQVPINVAATICDVEVNAIASSNDKGDKTCTATSASQPLADAIVEQAQ